jgi:AGZA family xanthine/uracil permease-like MFS transporter
VDNLTNLVVLAGILIGVFRFPADLVLYRMVPGTALGVLAGDLAYTWLAVRLARQSGRRDVTAMPFGIDTPSLFGMTFGVIGPVMLLTRDPVLAWKVGMGATIAMGVVKLLLAVAGEWVRRAVPRAGLLGSIAGVAIMLIAFLPALRIFADPLVGLVALGLILVSFVGRITLPGRIPGALAAVLAGLAVHALERGFGLVESGVAAAATPGTWRLAIPWPTLAWLDAVPETWAALPVALPFALATVIGGIDNTESAIAAGDRYRTRDILLTEALATILAGLCGGVIQNTPYIGHPAYKAMGARAAYTLATGLVIGLGAMAGIVSVLIRVLPEAALAPILVFIGLEITAQAFLATPARHAPAVAFAYFPTVARLLAIKLSTLVPTAVFAGLLVKPGKELPELLVTIALGNGFILTAMLWGAFLAEMIDRRLRRAALYLGILAVFTFFGVVHSASPDGTMYLPWHLAGLERAVPYQFGLAYAVFAALLLLLSLSKTSREPAAGGAAHSTPA